jgi:hypothetical protein
MPEPISKPPRGGSQLIFGICLLLLGAVLMAANLGFTIPINFRLHWPIPLILFGVVGLLFPSRHLGRVGGLWLLTSGLYNQTCISGWFGLDWGTAWPVFVIASGINVIMNRHQPKEATQVTHEV